MFEWVGLRVLVLLAIIAARLVVVGVVVVRLGDGFAFVVGWVGE